MKVTTAEEMSFIDKQTIEDCSVPAEILMNNAGRYVAEFIRKQFPGRKIVIISGKGNNGGDGLAAAYYLHSASMETSVYLAGNKNEISEDSRYFYTICEKNGVLINDLSEFDPENWSSVETVFIDSIFGTGFNGIPRGIEKSAIEKLKGTCATVLSVDVPSGLTSNGLVEHDCIVQADYTVTIGLPKVSLVTFPGRQYTGKMIIADIGFPEKFLNSDSLKRELIDMDFVREILLRDNNANPDRHKGDRGHTLIIGGFSGMEGAGLLAAKSLFNSGAGLVTLFTEELSREVIAGKIPELMTGIIDESSLDFTDEFIRSRKIKTIIIGPGLGRTEKAVRIFKGILKNLDGNYKGNLVIDGDGLYHFAEMVKAGEKISIPNVILTPHLIEAARFYDSEDNVSSISNDRLNRGEELSRITGAFVVLKGPCSIISDSERTYINTSGNSGMATGGSGDVLTGIIAGIINRESASTLDAVAASVYIHGLAGDLACDEFGKDTYSAGDIAGKIKESFFRIRYRNSNGINEQTPMF